MAEKITRTKTGIVISSKMDKTVIVQVDELKRHPKYHKGYKINKKFKAHDENNEYKGGDRVVIAETRPLSKDKHYKVIRKA